MYNQNTTALMEQETFVLPAMAESEFSSAELAEDMDGLQMSFQRVKIPAGGTIQFELPSDDQLCKGIFQSHLSESGDKHSDYLVTGRHYYPQFFTAVFCYHHQWNPV